MIAKATSSKIPPALSGERLQESAATQLGAEPERTAWALGQADVSPGHFAKLRFLQVFRGKE